MKITIVAIALTVWSLLLVHDLSPLNTRYGEEIRITSPIDGDVYLAAKKIIIDAPIRGDLVAAGASIIINDSVAADVLVFAGDVAVNGYVGDDVRAAGGNLTLSGTVVGDVLTASAELNVRKNATVNGNLTVSGGVLDIFGDVHGNVNAAGDKIDFRGTVGGSFDARANEIEIAGAVNGYSALSANTINVVREAKFGKDVRYWNDEGTLDITSEDSNIKVTYDPSIKVQQKRWELLGFASVLMLFWYLGTALVVIWMIEFLFSKTMLNAAGVVLERTIGSIGYGILFVIGVPLLCVLLAVTILAIPIAAILLFAYVSLIVMATAIASIIMANWINRVYYHSSWSVSHIVMVAFGVFIVMKLFTMTPVIGPTIMFVIACMAIGSIVISVASRTRKKVETA